MKNLLKKSCIGLVIGISSMQVLPVNADSENYFIVTAYYSPLPDQEYYITGNYEDELILNGRGIAGASGKSVFSGMLAAPGKYAFGTKIYLEGLGIGEVSDRGGAIVPAGQRGYGHDRIDVWMGYGDEGLRRANYWGKRKVYGYVANWGSSTTIDYNSVPAPGWATTGLTKSYTPPAIPTIFQVNLGLGNDGPYVEELQNMLTDLGYLDDAYIEGEYDNALMSAVYNFQIQHEVIQSDSDAGAGYYGPKTRQKLQELYFKFKEFEKQRQEILTQAREKAESGINALGAVSYGDISPEVRQLQKILAELGYFTVADTAIFGPQTQNALIEYQQSANIISQENSESAGIFGPATRQALIDDLAEIYFDRLIQEQGLHDEISYSAPTSDLEETHDEILQASIYSV